MVAADLGKEGQGSRQKGFREREHSLQRGSSKEPKLWQREKPSYAEKHPRELEDLTQARHVRHGGEPGGTGARSFLALQGRGLSAFKGPLLSAKNCQRNDSWLRS